VSICFSAACWIVEILRLGQLGGVRLQARALVFVVNLFLRCRVLGDFDVAHSSRIGPIARSYIFCWRGLLSAARFCSISVVEPLGDDRAALYGIASVLLEIGVRPV
jgi:hypothetical protein